MNIPSYYVLMVLLTLAVIAFFVFWIKPEGKRQKLSVLASLSFVLILAGIFFGAVPWLGYGLIGAGVILAVADIIMKHKARS